MAKPLMDDELWSIIRPLLPVRKRRWKFAGRKAMDDRTVLTGILFVLKTGIAWEDFPQEMGCCGMTLLNRLRQWHKAGVWERLHRVLLDNLRGADKIDFSRVIVDSTSVRALHGGKKQVKAPWTAEKQARNTIWQSTPMECRWQSSSPAPIAMTQLLPLVDAIPPVKGKRGAPLSKPKSVMADRAYHSQPHRAALSDRGIAEQIARRNTTHGSGLGVYRWYVEQSLALMHQFKRLRMRDDRDDEIHEDFMTIACAIMCWRKLHG